MSLLQSKGAGIDYLYGPFRLHRFIDPNAINALGRVPDPRDCVSGGSQSLCLCLELFHFPASSSLSGLLNEEKKSVV